VTYTSNLLPLFPIVRRFGSSIWTAKTSYIKELS
jgi:hypothetical protein